MNDEQVPGNLIDLEQARQQRQHDLNEARLQRMRQAFEQALPLPGRKPAPGKKKTRKSKSPRKKK